ncbi:MAG TPA: phosphoglucomutase/phosphomannomutase family protein, partial [Chitinophagales bacterium]|nr:phosphoglucomutase/phosphomannomutase family protein [Chitinophagales bacterium]
MSTQINFGTDGWRAIIADTFPNANVAKVATAVAKWLNQNHSNPSVTIGYDCRFGGQMFAE